MTKTLLTIAAYVLFLIFGIGIWCLSQLSEHIDDEKIRGEASIGAVLKQTPLPARVLTEKGKRMRKIGLISFVAGMFLFLVLFIVRLLDPL